MRKKLCRILSLMLILALCSGIPAMAAEARTNYYIDSGCASIHRNANGSITVYFDVVGTGTMTKIGASTIYVKDYSGTTVKTFTYPTYLSLQGSNRVTFGNSVTYYDAEPDVNYYAVVVLYAANSSGSGTLTVTAY